MITAVMTRQECDSVMTSGLESNLKGIVAFVESFSNGRGGFTSPRGKFYYFPIQETFWSTPTDDFHLHDDVATNRFGTEIKPVHCSFDRQRFYQGFLYLRVRRMAPPRPIHDIVDQLNRHLNTYVDDLRVEIAQEWAAQEPYRMYPKTLDECIQRTYNRAGRALGWYTPPFNLKQFMKDTLPNGYDDDREADHIIE